MIDSSITLFTGSEPVLSAYVGTTLVYPSPLPPVPPVPPTPVGPYDEMYLTTRALEDNTTIGFKLDELLTTSDATSISYSTDDGLTWNTTMVDGEEHIISVSGLSSGDTVIWKGTALRWSNANDNSSFYSDGYYDVYGNIMSLLYGDNFENATAVNSHSFRGLFLRNNNLLSAENLVLPATTLAYCCYQDMFIYCYSLTTAPELPATTLAVGCYDFMFCGCYSLTTAPELPATTLEVGCYYGMFESCRSLTTAPELPASTLVERCYFAMFRSCSRLNYIKCLATDISAHNCTYEWVKNVSSTGTFTKASGVSWPTGGSGIPSGWTVVEA